MKRWLVFSAFVALIATAFALPLSLASPLARADEPERLVSPGFESGLNGWERPPWFANVADLETKVVRSGERAFHFDGRRSGPYLQQDVPVNPGETVTLSGWVNVPVRDNAMDGIIEMLALNSHRGAIIGFRSYMFQSITDGWVQFSDSRVMPPAAAWVRLQIRFPALAGTVYLDDFSLTTAASAGATPTVTATATSTAEPSPTPTPTRTPTPADADLSTGAPDTPAPTPTATPLPMPTPVTDGATLWGAWVGAATNVAGDEAAFEEVTGKPRAIRHWYWSVQPLGYDAANLQSWAETMPAGALLMLSYAPAPTDSSLQNVNKGRHDEYIRTWAVALRDYGHEVWLRPMWEDNGGWYWWASGGDWDRRRKREYTEAFQRIVDIFREEGARNVRFVWSPNVRGAGASIPRLSYPGDDYVDIIGLDGYPLRGGLGDFYSAFKPDYDDLGELGKPLIVAETNISLWSDRERAAYIENVLTYELPQRFPGFKAFIWFSEPGWGDLMDPRYPATMEALRRGLALPHYEGR